MIKGCNLSDLSVLDEVYLERIKLFSGHAGGNAVAIQFGAALLIIVFYVAGVPVTNMAIWFGSITLFAASILYLESLFRKATLTIENAKRWLTGRVVFLLAINQPLMTQ
jgi:cobalamin biosynthesis protein CbiG